MIGAAPNLRSAIQKQVFQMKEAESRGDFKTSQQLASNVEKLSRGLFLGGMIEDQLHEVKYYVPHGGSLLGGIARGQQIGRGSTANVYLTDEQNVVVKIARTAGHNQQINAERARHVLLQNQGVHNILQCFPNLIVDNVHMSYMCLEKAVGTLRDHRHLLNNPVLREQFGREIRLALQDMHDHGFHHYDVQDHNIYLVEEDGQLHARLGDFGQSEGHDWKDRYYFERVFGNGSWNIYAP